MGDVAVQPASLAAGSAASSTGNGRLGVRSGDVAFCVNWAGSLEALRLPSSALLLEVAKMVATRTDAPAEHKFFIYKGRLLPDHLAPLSSIQGFADGSILHLVLNDSLPPPPPRAVLVRTASAVAAVPCHEDESVEELKEKLALLPGMPPPEEQRLSFAGRVLQDRYSLRQYNIQKPSVLRLLPPAPQSMLHRCVRASVPAPAQTDVPVSLRAVRLRLFLHPDSLPQSPRAAGGGAARGGTEGGGGSGSDGREGSGWQGACAEEGAGDGGPVAGEGNQGERSGEWGQWGGERRGEADMWAAEVLGPPMLRSLLPSDFQVWLQCVWGGGLGGCKHACV